MHDSSVEGGDRDRVSSTAAEGLRAREAAIAATEAFAARLSAAILAGLESDIAPPRPAPVEVRALYCTSSRTVRAGGDASVSPFASTATTADVDAKTSGESRQEADRHHRRRAYADDLRAPVPRPAIGAFTLLDLAPGLCRYPHGERVPYRFCGDAALPGDSYCPRHAALCRRAPGAGAGEEGGA